MDRVDVTFKSGDDFMTSVIAPRCNKKICMLFDINSGSLGCGTYNTAINDTNTLFSHVSSKYTKVFHIKWQHLYYCICWHIRTCGGLVVTIVTVAFRSVEQQLKWSTHVALSVLSNLLPSSINQDFIKQWIVYLGLFYATWNLQMWKREIHWILYYR